MRKLVAAVPPVPKPRMTQSDKWKERPCVVQYRNFCDALRGFANHQRFELPECGVEFRFFIQMPASWSKRKRTAMRGRPHQSKPDLDNLVKAVVDALSPGDDAHVWQFTASKVWADRGRIEIEARTVEQAA